MINAELNISKIVYLLLLLLLLLASIGVEHWKTNGDCVGLRVPILAAFSPLTLLC